MTHETANVYREEARKLLEKNPRDPHALRMLERAAKADGIEVDRTPPVRSHATAARLAALGGGGGLDCSLPLGDRDDALEPGALG